MAVRHPRHRCVDAVYRQFLTIAKEQYPYIPLAVIGALIVTVLRHQIQVVECRAKSGNSRVKEVTAARTVRDIRGFPDGILGKSTRATVAACVKQRVNAGFRRDQVACNIRCGDVHNIPLPA